MADVPVFKNPPKFCVLGGGSEAGTYTGKGGNEGVVCVEKAFLLSQKTTFQADFPQRKTMT